MWSPTFEPHCVYILTPNTQYKWKIVSFFSVVCVKFWSREGFSEVATQLFCLHFSCGKQTNAIVYSATISTSTE